MRKVSLKGLDLDLYSETLINGLEVYMIPFSNKKNYFMSYATRYGSEVTSFVDIDTKKEIKVPDGIAHFLEHKMFEQEDGVDPFTYFSESGTGANASTSFDNTQYICYGTKNFSDNLKFLLNYVNQPYYTDSNVEKEKGIIGEEIKMYADIPEWQMETRLREAIYHIHPRRIDIGGSIEEINKITKEDLYKCYNNFYCPNNMFVLLVGNFDVEEASRIIHREMDSVSRKNIPVIKKIDEPREVKDRDVTIHSNIKLPKIGVGFKIPTDKLEDYDPLKLDLYLEMISTICFGSSSEFRERVRNKKLLNSLYMEWESIDGFKTYLMIASTKEPDTLIDEIKSEVKNINISADVVERVKKVWIANEVRMADYIDSVVNNVYDDLIRYKRVVTNRIDEIRSLNLEELNDILSKIDFNNCSVVKLLGKDE